MNSYEQLIIFELLNDNRATQRDIAKNLNVSLGLVNKTISNLRKKGYIDDLNQITLLTKQILSDNNPKNAIILAAGAGLRMSPVGNEVSKGLLKVNGQILIERLLKQLNSAGIEDITIVTGFKKEMYEYLKNKYNVKLLYNNDFLVKNNAYSLSLAKDIISNTYILPCDIYLENNIFSKNEIGSWYGVIDLKKENSFFSYNKKSRMIEVSEVQPIEMSGVAFINKNDGETIKNVLGNLSMQEKRDGFWENMLSEIILENHLRAKFIDENNFFEINNYEDLRKVDAESENLTSKITMLLEEIFDTNIKNVKNIEVMKTGMTNRSFKFDFKGDSYIMRIPGFGTNKLINRTEEMEVYKIVSKELISDELIYISDINGFKVTKYIKNSRVCNPFDEDDVKKAMITLKKFHEKNLIVDHSFELREKIEYYEEIAEGAESSYVDYEVTKEKIYKLLDLIDNMKIERKLCHIDAVPDNFLFYEDGIKLIDWEYGAMQDPHLDIAMFAIYAIYNKKQVDNLISAYFGKMPNSLIVGKIYAYIAISGLLWSNWCEYKKLSGSDFGEYSVNQYRYAVDYYDLAIDKLKGEIV